MAQKNIADSPKYFIRQVVKNGDSKEQLQLCLSNCSFCINQESMKNIHTDVPYKEDLRVGKQVEAIWSILSLETKQLSKKEQQ